jgi:hypothetical protein
MSAVPEITPTEYVHAAKTERQSKSIVVTSPLQWVLSYSGFNPRRLKELLADRTRTGPEIGSFVVHTLLLHLVLARQPGIAKILEALHFTVQAARRPESGDLPVTLITSVVTTIRPPDDVLIESTEISGMDAFEEVVDLEAVAKIRDPFKEKLEELLKGQGEGLSAE